MGRSFLLSPPLLVVVAFAFFHVEASAFAPASHRRPLSPQRHRAQLLVRSMQQAAETGAKPRSQPRSGLGQQLLNLALASPLWEYVLVPQARASIVKTAEGKSLNDECEDIHTFPVHQK